MALSCDSERQRAVGDVRVFVASDSLNSKNQRIKTTAEILSPFCYLTVRAALGSLSVCVLSRAVLKRDEFPAATRYSRPSSLLIAPALDLPIYTFSMVRHLNRAYAD